MKVSIIIPTYNVEKYIRNMLTCIKNQTYEDFEVIIVDDGSTDNSGKIAEEFVSQDERFHYYYKENGGVSSARNLGIEKATGDLMVFWDPDDEVPKDALENMHNIIIEKKADMVIGAYENNWLTSQSVPKTLGNLIEQEYISKMDYRLIWVFSCANRLFKTSIIKENNLRFNENLALGEDAVFFITYMGYCDKIAGCNHKVYKYNHRFFLENSFSLTQRGSRYSAEYFRLYISSLEIACENLFPENKSAEEEYYRNRLFQELYKRLIKNNVIYDMYRKIWLLSEEDVKIMEDIFLELKQKLFFLEYDVIKASEKDISLKEKLLTPLEISKEPIITFVITRNVDPEYVDYILESLYRQAFPLFEVIFDENLKDCIKNQDYIDNENFNVLSELSLGSLKNEALAKAKGKYIMFFDENIIPSERTIKDAISKIKDTENIVSLYVKQYKNKKVEEIKLYKQTLATSQKESIMCVDAFFSNKIFKVSFLKTKSIIFTNNPIEDIKNIYGKYKVNRKKNPVMVTTLEEKFFENGFINWTERRFLSKIKKK